MFYILCILIEKFNILYILKVVNNIIWGKAFET